MDPLLQFIVGLAIVITTAKAAGYISNRLGQPAVLGELIIGLILGPTLLDMLHWPLFAGGHLEEAFKQLAYLGVLFLIFIAGLEVHLGDMIRSGRPAVLAGLGGVVGPVVLGMAMALSFGFDLQASAFIGLMLAATSVGISVQCLLELGVMRNREGLALLGAAVVDDIVVIFLLSLFIAFIGGEGGETAGMIWMVVKMIAFMGIALWLGARFLTQLATFIDRLPISQGMIALVIVIVLLYSWAAEALGGMAAITGAFLAGVLFARTPFRQYIETGMHTIAYSWLVPVFFVSIGLEANARTLGVEGLPFAALLVVVAIASKVFGSGLGAIIGGMSRIEAMRLGVGMVARGEVTLIVASVGLKAGLIDEDVFASTVLMVLAAAILTPIMLQALYPQRMSSTELEKEGGT